MERKAMSIWIRALSAIVVSSNLCSPASAQFDRVLNIPPDPNLPAGYHISDRTQVNLGPGGSIGSGWSASNNLRITAGATDGENSGIEINVEGGSLLAPLAAFSGSVVNFSSGWFPGRLLVDNGSYLNLSGGEQPDDFNRGLTPSLSANNNSIVTMTGGKLGRVTPQVVVNNGSHFDLRGGVIGEGNVFDEGFSGESSVGVLNSSTFVMTGGRLESGLRIESNSTGHISSGVIGHRIDSPSIRAYSGATLSITGGVHRAWFFASSGGEIHLYGNDFTLDGVPIAGLDEPGDVYTVSTGMARSTLAGVLADGSPLASSLNTSIDGQIFLHATTLPPIGSDDLVAPRDGAPQSIRQGQTMLVEEGGALPDYFRAGSGSVVVVREGGTVGMYADAHQAQILVDGGDVDFGLRLFESELIISNGFVNRMFVEQGSRVSILGGRTEDIYSRGGSVVIDGGDIGNVDVTNATVVWSGGTVDRFLPFEDGLVQIVGSQFFLDGSPVAPATPGVPFELPRFGNELTGRLADGSEFQLAFDVYLKSEEVVLLLVPEPASSALIAIVLLVVIFRKREQNSKRPAVRHTSGSK